MRKILMILGFVMFIAGIAFAKDTYYCPMHPTYTSNHPGTCPICNMKLVKQSMDPILSDDEQVKKHLGQICLIHNCHAGHDGRPCPMMVMVKKGEKVTCPICGTHLAGYPSKDIMTVNHASVKIDGYKRQLIGVKTVPVEEKIVIKTIRAYGKVSRDERWVFAELFEYERPFLYAGEKPFVGLQQKVEVDVPALPGHIFTGRARLLDNDIDPVTRTTRIRVELDKWYKVLKPDMSANVNIKADVGQGLTVPVSAVLDTGTRKIVFVDNGNGVIEPRGVVLGERGDNDYQVLSGLKKDELVVVSGNFLIDSESRMKAVLESANLQEMKTEEHQHEQ